MTFTVIDPKTGEYPGIIEEIQSCISEKIDELEKQLEEL